MRPYYESGGITVYHGRAEDVLPTLEPVDVVITDPPYSEYTHSKQRRGSTLPDAAERWRACVERATELGFSAITPELMRFSAEQIGRLVRRWALVFSDVEIAHEWRAVLEAAGLQYVRTGAWVKLNTTPQFTGDRPGVGFESITIAHPRGRKRWNGGGSPAVWSVPIVINRHHNGERRVHTTQKPIRLMRQLVQQFTEPGEVVLDFFAGSGTTLRACKDLGRRAIGVEMSEAYCERIVERLAQETMALELPA